MNVNSKSYIELIRYVDGNMDEKEIDKFEKSLKRSKEKFSLLLQIKQDLVKMEENRFKNIPSYLFDKVFLINKDKIWNKINFSSTEWGQIILKISNQKFKVLSNSFSLIKKNSKLMIYRNSDFDYQHLSFKKNGVLLVILGPLNNKYFRLFLNFDQKNENFRVSLFSVKNKLLASFTSEKDLSFLKLKFGEYFLEFQNKKLNIKIIP